MMKFILFAALVSTALAQLCDFTPKNDLTEAANTMCLFSKPTIIGASVSAGFGTSTGGPASILSRMLNPDTELDNRAVSGATSMEITRRLEIKKAPSILLGFDLFFWDAVKNQCDDAFVENTRRVFKMYQDKNIPMVIGKIPIGAPFPAGVRLAGTRPCSRVINKLIDELCTTEKNCLVYDPKDCITAMKNPMSPEGVNYFRDPLHTSTEGNKFCASQFIEAASFKELTCTLD